MKIWRNDKRVVKSSRYVYCKDCVLYGDPYQCLAILYDIHDPINACLSGYKYETDV